MRGCSSNSSSPGWEAADSVVGRALRAQPSSVVPVMFLLLAADSFVGRALRAQTSSVVDQMA